MRPPARPRVLLVSRAWQPRALLRAELEEAGYEVTALDDLTAGLRALLTGRPYDLALIDTQGQSLPRPLQEELVALAREMPIIILTGPFDVGDLHPDLRQRALLRPLFVRDVLARVRELLPARQPPT